MTTLIEQDIPLEMKYRPTVAYEASEVLPNTVYLDANGRQGTANLPEHLRQMVDPRQLNTVNPDPNAQATALVNAALAMNGAARPTVVRKLNGETVRVVFENHERTPALPGRRTLADIRAGRSRNVPLQTASLADLNDAFEEGRAGMTAATAKGLRSHFARMPEAAQGMANVARARDAARAIDPTTGINMQSLNRMPASVRKRLAEVKSTHSGAKAAIIFHPKKTNYRTPNTPGYRGPSRPGLKPDATLRGIGAMVPGTSQEVLTATTARVVSLPQVPTAAGSGTLKRAEIVARNLASASAAEQAVQATSEAREQYLADQEAAATAKALQSARNPVVSPNGTVEYQLAEAGTGFEEVPTKCGWKCWLLLGLTALGLGGGAYALLKK